MRAVFFVVLLLPFMILGLVDYAFAADTWTAATTTNVGTTLIRGVSMSDASNGVAVGPSGTIVYTSDGGDTWTDATTTNVGITSMYGVSMSDANNGVAVGKGGTIVYTSDGGDTWTAASTTNVGTTSMRGVSMSDASNGVAVGPSGKIVFADSSSSEDSSSTETSSSKSGACGFDRDCTAPRITKHGISETPDGFSINNVIFEENQKFYNENPTVEIGIGELTTIKTRAWENMGPEKIFLAIAYLDMQGTKPDWRDSKAYIEYDIKDDNITIHDENKMFLAQASTEIVKDPYGDNQGLEFLDITFSLMFTKPMETSHVAIQVVDHIRNYELVYFKDALKVVDRPISEMPEFPGKIEKANTTPKQDEDIHFVLAVNGTEDTIFAAVDGDAIPLEEMNKEEPKVETPEERDARYHLKAKQSEQYERLLEYIAESQALYPDAWNKIVGSDNVSNQMEHVTDGTKTNVVKNDRRR